MLDRNAELRDTDALPPDCPDPGQRVKGAGRRYAIASSTHDPLAGVLVRAGVRVPVSIWREGIVIAVLIATWLPDSQLLAPMGTRDWL